MRIRPCCLTRVKSNRPKNQAKRQESELRGFRAPPPFGTLYGLELEQPVQDLEETGFFREQNFETHYRSV